MLYFPIPFTIAIKNAITNNGRSLYLLGVTQKTMIEYRDMAKIYQCVVYAEATGKRYESNRY